MAGAGAGGRVSVGAWEREWACVRSSTCSMISWTVSASGLEMHPSTFVLSRDGRLSSHRHAHISRSERRGNENEDIEKIRLVGIG